VGVVDRRLMDAGRDAADTLGRFELTVTGRSRPIEKKWYRDAVRDVRDWLAAMEVFEAWQQSSGYEQVAEEWHRVRVSGEPDPAPYAGVSTRRHLKRERRKTLASIGDPTAPGWRPSWRSRWAAYVRRLKAASGQAEPEKPKRRTVYVPVKGGDLRAVTVEVHADRTARLPEFGLDMHRWQFPPESRVQCEWRPVDDRTALVAVALAPD
jgi:hypothetical protein